MNQNLATIRLNHYFAFSPERVFDAWFCATHRWFFATQSGQSVSFQRDGDATDRCWLVSLHHSQGARGILTTMPRMLIQNVVIERPHRAVIDLPEHDATGQKTRFTIEIVPADEGCEFNLTIEGILEDKRIELTDRWKVILERLAQDIATFG